MRLLPVVAVADSRGGGSLVLRVLLGSLALLALVGALVVLLVHVEQVIMLSSPAVRDAQARLSVAEANHQTAELDRQTASIRAQQAAEAGWQPWLVGAGHLAVLALLVAVPAAVILALVAGVLMFKRHLSLPTSDGRVPLVGLDRELSREALLRYQALRGKGATFEALPVGRSRVGLEGLLEPEQASAVESGGEAE